MKFKLHYNETNVNGERFCHQDNMRGGCTTVVAYVTCKKCLKSAMKKSIKAGNNKMANDFASQLITLQIKSALFPKMKLL